MNTIYLLMIIIMLPGIILGVYSQNKVYSTYKRYNRVLSSKGIPVGMCAKMMLDAGGAGGVKIKYIQGELSDHYDPRDKSISISSNPQDTSISAIGVTAHEVGHALQDAERYPLLTFRKSIVPIVNFCSTLYMPLIIIGIIIMAVTTFSSIGSTLIWIAVALYGLTTIFYLITYPVERNASKRALANLKSQEILTDSELNGAKEVLNVASLTYLAGLLTSIAMFLRVLIHALYYIGMFGKRR